MTTLIFIEPTGARREVAAKPGNSLMIAATTAGVAGIAAECGGSAMCATCHCLVVDGPVEALPALTEAERDTLEFTASDMQANSRLICQIPVSPQLDGLVLKVVGA